MTTRRSAPLCPRDGSELEVRGWMNSHYGFCSRCHGIRIERSSLERIARSGSRPPLTRVEEMADDVEIVEDTALCSCQGQPLMHRVTRDDLSLDVCPRCGAFWFDADEMQCYLATRATPPAVRLGNPKRRSSGGLAIIDGVGTIGELIFGILDLFA